MEQESGPESKRPKLEATEDVSEAKRPKLEPKEEEEVVSDVTNKAENGTVKEEPPHLPGSLRDLLTAIRSCIPRSDEAEAVEKKITKKAEAIRTEDFEEEGSLERFLVLKREEILGDRDNVYVHVKEVIDRLRALSAAKKKRPKLEPCPSPQPSTSKAGQATDEAEAKPEPTPSTSSDPPKKAKTVSSLHIRYGTSWVSRSFKQRSISWPLC